MQAAPPHQATAPRLDAVRRARRPARRRCVSHPAPAASHLPAPSHCPPSAPARDRHRCQRTAQCRMPPESRASRGDQRQVARGLRARRETARRSEDVDPFEPGRPDGTDCQDPSRPAPDNRVRWQTRTARVSWMRCELPSSTNRRTVHRRQVMRARRDARRRDRSVARRRSSARPAPHQYTVHGATAGGLTARKTALGTPVERQRPLGRETTQPPGSEHSIGRAPTTLPRSARDSTLTIRQTSLG